MFTITDPIHGSIELDETEEWVIDDPLFQRLRRIKALGFLDRVFPGARHTRFEHSIGACHVAGRLFDAIKKISLDISATSAAWNSASPYSAAQAPILEKLFSSEMRRATRLAALLHDIGHGPFSHASESLMLSRDQLIRRNPEAPSWLITAIKKRKKKGTQADHEDYSLLLMNQILVNAKVREPLRRLALSVFKSDLISPPISHDQGHVKLMGALIDGEFDSDRMDYLLRDSYFCGVPYGNYDLNRLLEGICVVQENKGGKLSLAIRRTSLSAFEHFLFSRFQMHVQVYTHRIDAMFNKSFEAVARSQEWRLPPNIQKYSKYDDESLLHNTGGKLKALTDLLYSRESWPMLFESFASEEANDRVIIQKFQEGIKSGLIAIDFGKERLFRKPELLDLPVLGKDLSRQFYGEKAKALSQMIAHYNGSYCVRRVFVAPSQKEKAQEIFEGLTPEHSTRHAA